MCTERLCARYRLFNPNLQEEDAMDTTLYDLDSDDDFAFVDLGPVEEVTGLFADGNNRDGGWVPGHNYSYE